ncbi:Na+/H+ antiporter NhaD type [Vibrio astriarenae]|nr:Na+/H+ antiporter NhaD type [Vibrio sp. C7]
MCRRFESAWLSGLASEIMYTQWDPIWANVMVGILSAIVDNIPVMFAVLTMDCVING